MPGTFRSNLIIPDKNYGKTRVFTQTLQFFIKSISFVCPYMHSTIHRLEAFNKYSYFILAFTIIDVI